MKSARAGPRSRSSANYAVTQEQRGENELVTCYRLKQASRSGRTPMRLVSIRPIPVGGLGDIGPRATPTIHGDRIYTQGGTGIVNCLDAHDGRRALDTRHARRIWRSDHDLG